MKKVIFFSLIIIALACTKEAEKIKDIQIEDKSLNSQILGTEYQAINLIDTFSGKLRLDTSSTKSVAEFFPIYIGKKDSASIKLNYKPSEIGYRDYSNSSIFIRDAEQLAIYVDTSRIIGMPMDLWEYYKAPEKRRDIQAYPVFIENKGVDTIRIGYGDVIPIVMEAKDKSNKWNKIETLFSYYCGTGLSSFILKPENIIVTSCKLFNGDFKTKIRLSLESNPKIYSNEFDGFINEKQFEKTR